MTTQDPGIDNIELYRGATYRGAAYYSNVDRANSGSAVGWPETYAYADDGSTVRFDGDIWTPVDQDADGS